MSRRKPSKMQRIVQEGEFTPVEDTQNQEPVADEQLEGQQVVNLDDVGFMVMVGRYKTGEPFLIHAGGIDVMTVRGLLEWGVDEVKAANDEYRKGNKE